MKTSAIAGLLALALVLAGTFILILSRGTNRRGGGPEHKSSAQAAAQEAEERTAVELEAPVVPERAAETSIERSELSRSEVETRSTSVPQTWVVRVLRDGAPAASVEVGWASAEALRRLPADGKAAKLDFTERVRAAGELARTDQAGELVIPALPSGSRIVAWDGVLLAFHDVKEDQTSPIVLELAVDRTLLVRVLDTSGKPCANVPVLLEVQDGRNVYPWKARTALQGLATFRHIGVGSALDSRSAAGTVSIDAPLAQPEEATFRFQDWPEEPLELRLVEHGSVVVEVVEESGKPVPKFPRGVTLSVKREQAAGAVLYGRQRIEQEVVDGRARFEPVGLGLTLEASLDARPERDQASTTFAGPIRAGEEVLARLVLPEPKVVLIFRALNDRGEVLTNRRFESEVTRALAGSSISSAPLSYESDGEGRLRIPLFETWSEGMTLTVVLKHRDPSSGEALEAELDVSREPPPGEMDLGDVVLESPNVLVAGRVIDDAGAPVASAQICVKAYEQSAGEEPRLWSTHYQSAGSDGRFSIPDREISAELRLIATALDFISSDPLPFERHERDLVITLHRGGALEGSIVPPEGVSASAFRAEAFPTEIGRDLAEDRDRVQRSSVDGGGGFLLRGLTAGRVTVAVRLAPGDELLLEIPDVEVVDGETMRDPRLQQIELAERVRALSIAVLRPDGRPADGGWVHVCGDGDGGDGGEPAFLIENGEALVIGPAEPLELEVNVPGFRIARLLAVESDREVVLEHAFQVRLELDPEVELLPEGTMLQVRLESVGGSGGSGSGRLGLYRGAERTGWWSSFFGADENTFGVSREVFVTIQESGTYAVQFYLVIGQPDGAMSSSSISPSDDTHPLGLDESDADDLPGRSQRRRARRVPRERALSTLVRFEGHDGFVGYRSPSLASMGVPHVFTTRRGGAGRELDLGDLCAENLERLATAAGVERARVVGLRQVHGSEVLVVDGAEIPRSLEGDALVGERPDRLLLVRTADCVPVLVAGAGGRRVAAIHAGWRGLVAGVIPRALEVLGVAPQAAAIGPCISPARFEVGPEVAQAFEQAGLGEALAIRTDGRGQVDLSGAALLQLCRAGVRLIDVSDRCTWEDPELFSHRRDVTHGGRQTTGRTGAVIAARG